MVDNERPLLFEPSRKAVFFNLCSNPSWNIYVAIRFLSMGKTFWTLSTSYMSQESCSFLYSDSLYKFGHDFLDMQYLPSVSWWSWHKFPWKTSGDAGRDVLWPAANMLLLCTIVNIVAIVHGLLKKFRPIVIGCVVHTAGSSLNWNYADPLNSLELPNCYLTLALRSSIKRSNTKFFLLVMKGFCDNISMQVLVTQNPRSKCSWSQCQNGIGSRE